MRRSSFEVLRPACPACRSRERVDSPLFIATAETGTDADIDCGILQCGRCSGEFPVIDGMAILVPDVRRFVEDNLFYLMARTDLPPAVESLLGDAAGASSGLQSIRQHMSSYVWDHWGDHDPAEQGEAAGGARPGSVARALERGLSMLSGKLPDGPILDLGCGPGRVAAELAARTGRLVVAADLSVALARVARRVVADGIVEYPNRRVGVVYDRRRFSVAVPGSEKVEVWICDALNLPFKDETFALATAMNLIDCVTEPRSALSELGRVIRPGGEALIALPFDWTDRVTGMEHWLGGHSQRGWHQGRAEDVLDLLLSDGEMAAGPLRRTGEAAEIPWHVRLHDRSCMHYTCRMVSARRDSASDATASERSADQG